MHTLLVPLSFFEQSKEKQVFPKTITISYSTEEKSNIQEFQQQYATIETDNPLALIENKEAVYLLEESLKLSCYCPLDGSSSPILSLYFHTVEDAIAYTLKYPEPSIQLPLLVAKDAKLLAEGKLVAFPTETVYGLGADATNEIAVKGIFTAKQRPFFDPLIVHIADLRQLEGLVSEIPPKAKELMNAFWPGPLTMIMKKHPSVPDIVTGGSETVGIRMPDNPLALALIRASGKPIAAPSANKFGYTSPTTSEHVQEQLAGRIDAILDGGACTVGIESTVLAMHTEVPTILRPGKIGIEELQPILGKIEIGTKVGPTDKVLESPGLLESHYAPTTPLYLVDDVSLYREMEDVGVLLFDDTDLAFKGPVEYISEHKNGQTAAMRLYWAIRKLDTMHLRFMVCSLLPEKGIGVAVNNRLRKASTKKGQPSY